MDELALSVSLQHLYKALIKIHCKEESVAEAFEFIKIVAGNTAGFEGIGEVFADAIQKNK